MNQLSADTSSTYPGKLRSGYIQSNSLAIQAHLVIEWYSQDPHFPWSTVIKIRENGSDSAIGIAIHQDQNRIIASRIHYQSDGSIGSVYQLHQNDIQELQENGVFKYYQDIHLERQKDTTKINLLHLYRWSDSMDPWIGRLGDESIQAMIQSTKEILWDMDFEEQADLAHYFFAQTIWKDLSYNYEAYKIWYVLKDTEFGKVFHALEDTRLKNAWYKEGFVLS
jgi:hypothetical protein